MREIPPDHLISPLEGRLLAPLSLGPEYPWQQEVWWAEHLATYLEIGRQGPLGGMPVSLLYAPLVERYRGTAAELEGWTVEYADGHP